jgi:hypothetical protein
VLRTWDNGTPNERFQETTEALNRKCREVYDAHQELVRLGTKLL